MGEKHTCGRRRMVVLAGACRHTQTKQRMTRLDFWKERCHAALRHHYDLTKRAILYVHAVKDLEEEEPEDRHRAEHLLELLQILERQIFATETKIDGLKALILSKDKFWRPMKWSCENDTHLFRAKAEGGRLSAGIIHGRWRYMERLHCQL